MAKQYLEIRESKSLELYDFDGSVESVLHFVEGLKDEYGAEAYIDICQIWDDIQVEISWTRQETDVERDKRLTKAQKARKVRKAEREAVEDRERAELARLQEKYS